MKLSYFEFSTLQSHFYKDKRNRDYFVVSVYHDTCSEFDVCINGTLNLEFEIKPEFNETTPMATGLDLVNVYVEFEDDQTAMFGRGSKVLARIERRNETLLQDIADNLPEFKEMWMRHEYGRYDDE